MARFADSISGPRMSIGTGNTMVVIEAYERLVTAGYDRRLIPDPRRA